jgi:hypothetical protein
MDGTRTPTQVDLGAAPAGSHFTDKGDFNGDRKIDLMFQNDAPALQLWQMNGTEVLNNSQIGPLTEGWHLQI